MTFVRKRDDFELSDDPTRLDRRAIHAFLSQSYWAGSIPFDLVSRSIEHSLNFGLYHHDQQIGFARYVTDRSTFAYLCDVYVLEEYRGRRLGLWLVNSSLEHPDLQGLRRMMLVTRDSQPLYAKSGFTSTAHPERVMEIARSGIYKQAEVSA